MSEGVPGVPGACPPPWTCQEGSLVLPPAPASLHTGPPCPWPPRPRPSGPHPRHQVGRSAWHAGPSAVRPASRPTHSAGCGTRARQTLLLLSEPETGFLFTRPRARL